MTPTDVNDIMVSVKPPRLDQEHLVARELVADGRCLTPRKSPTSRLGLACAAVAGLALASIVARSTSAQSEEPISHESRVAIESLGGIVGGAAGGGVGTLIAYLAMDQPGGLGVLGALAFGGIPGATFGLPAGVYATGEALGGDGNFWATLGGVGLGAVIPLIVTIGTMGQDPPDWLMYTLWIVFPTAGGVIGYELSQPEPDEGTTSTGAALRLDMQPILWFGGRF